MPTHHDPFYILNDLVVHEIVRCLPPLDLVRCSGVNTVWRKTMHIFVTPNMITEIFPYEGGEVDWGPLASLGGDKVFEEFRRIVYKITSLERGEPTWVRKYTHAEYYETAADWIVWTRTRPGDPINYQRLTGGGVSGLDVGLQQSVDLQQLCRGIGGPTEEKILSFVFQHFVTNEDGLLFVSMQSLNSHTKGQQDMDTHLYTLYSLPTRQVLWQSTFPEPHGFVPPRPSVMSRTRIYFTIEGGIGPPQSLLAYPLSPTQSFTLEDDPLYRVPLEPPTIETFFQDQSTHRHSLGFLPLLGNDYILYTSMTAQPTGPVLFPIYPPYLSSTRFTLFCGATGQVIDRVTTPIYGGWDVLPLPRQGRFIIPTSTGSRCTLYQTFTLNADATSLTRTDLSYRSMPSPSRQPWLAHPTRDVVFTVMPVGVGAYRPVVCQPVPAATVRDLDSDAEAARVNALYLSGRVEGEVGSAGTGLPSSTEVWSRARDGEGRGEVVFPGSLVGMWWCGWRGVKAPTRVSVESGRGMGWTEGTEVFLFEFGAGF